MDEVQQGRRASDVSRERRVGPSRLSQWKGRQLAVVSLAWAGCVVALLALGSLASIGELHGATELRIAFSRSHIIGLCAVLVVPPACLTIQWWLMHRRRRGPLDDRRAAR